MLETKSVTEFSESEVVLGVFGVAGVVATRDNEAGGGGVPEGGGEEGEGVDC